MQNKAILDALNAAGEALAALGENSVTLGRYQIWEPEPRFTCRLELEGTTGIQASASTWGGALVKALADREERRRELAEEAEIRAEIEARRSHRKAA